jgi:AraC family transcriptional regulator
MSHTETVYSVLSRSHARLEAEHALGRGQSMAVWANERDRVVYDGTRLHVLTLYLEGGHNSRRADAGLRGHSGSLCLLPQGNRSIWEINGRFRFAHLYLTDERLRHVMATELDREPSTLDLTERTFFDDSRLADAMARLAALSGPGPDAEALVAGICHDLLTRPEFGGRPARPVTGGLSPATARRIIAMLAAAPTASWTLEAMAAEAGLSPFHFQRMFRKSLGITPQAFLDDLRIDAAKCLIRQGMPLAEVAVASGYCHQSHFTRAFRSATGTTPGAWRSAL